MKLNRPTRKVTYESRGDAIENYEGGLAFKMNPKLELYQRSVSCLFGEPKFYAKTDSIDLVKLARQVLQTDPEYVLKLATYSRNDLYLRTTPIVLLVEAANSTKEAKLLVYKYAPYIIRRADELAETLAYQLAVFKKPIPNCLKKSLAKAMNGFDQYALAKYNRESQVKLRDVILLTHPKPKNKEQSEIYKKILEKTLESPETWEVQISTKGSTKETWESIAPKMGYMALLRNLRNFLQKGVQLDPIIKRLTDPIQIQKSKQFPYRFYSAYKEIEKETNPNAVKVLGALETALLSSASNYPKLGGITFLSADNSGSMDDPISGKSKMKRKEIANLTLTFAHQFCENPITSIFADDIKIIQLSRLSSRINNAQKLNQISGGTNGYRIPQHLFLNKIFVDRIMVFTDEEMYDTTDSNNLFVEEFNKYRSSINPKVKLYIVNLAGYGTTQIPEKDPNTMLIGGFSDRIFEYIKLFEEGFTNAVDQIQKLDLSKYQPRKVIEE